MKSYLELVNKVLEKGVERSDRTGVGTLSLFGETLRFDMRDGFPLITTKKVPFSLPMAEVLWMLEGSGNVKDLHKYGAHFWDKWANPQTGDLGRVYGVQWRTWRKYRVMDGNVFGANYDQVGEAVNLLRTNPTSRRILVSAWNPGELDEMALPPCPYSHQLYVAEGGLSMIVNWRSVDVGIGLPFDIAAYALLLHMYAWVTGYEPRELICHMADTHIYLNHLDQLRLQSMRTPKRLPHLEIRGQGAHMRDLPERSMFDFQPMDFDLSGYDPHSHIVMAANV